MTKLFLLLPGLGSFCFLIFVACGSPPIDVEDLVRRAPVYDRQIITVKGCYFLGFETEILSTCTHTKSDPNWEDKSVWVERYSVIEEQEKWIGPRTDIRRPERKSTNTEKQKEMQLSGSPKAVIMRGEFQSSIVPQFGHLGKYKYQFILHRVESVAEIRH
jgi:hypothetical protein